MTMSRSAGLAVSLCVVALAACSSGHHAPKTTAPDSPPSTGTPAPKVNPLTGGAPSNHPVVAVKIDDTAAGRPQLGIDAADIVYVEQVEGGLTRLMAIYNTRLPKVEPVRSTRVGDPDLAMQFGPIVYVASGGSQGELAPLKASTLRSTLGDRGGPGFSRDSSRSAPFNLTADLAGIAARLMGPAAKSTGLTWSARVTGTGSRPGTAVSTMVGGTPVTFAWNAAQHRYARTFDGTVQRAADGKPVTTPNVIVQSCRITTFAGDIDQDGNPAKVTHTVGSGKVSVFRDGRRIEGTWTRASVRDGTHLKDAHGQPIALTPGGAWFVLVATGTSVT